MKAYTPPAANKFDILEDWREYVADEGAQQVNMSYEAQEATLQGWIPWEKQDDAIRHFLGYAHADIAAPWTLHRENPARHPLFPRLRCHSFSTSSVIVESNPVDEFLRPKIESPFPDTGLYTGNYKYVLATVKYRNMRLNYGEDADGLEEWQRNTYFDFAPKIEALSADGASNLVFAETGTSPPPPPPPAKAIIQPTAGRTAFPAPVAELLAKADFTITWTAVPWFYVSTNDYYFYPLKILQCLGRINSDVFMEDFEAGTLLLSGVEGTEFDFPVSSEDINVPLRGFHVKLFFNYFDPVRGATSPLTRGHNLFPWRENGKFYYCSRKGSTDLDEGMYRRAAFANMFKHAQS